MQPIVAHASFRFCALAFLVVSSFPTTLSGQTLEEQLGTETPAALAHAARAEGDPQRGAILFHQPRSGCAKCHQVDEQPGAAGAGLGPNLTRLPSDATDASIVESILRPSQAIRQGYETVTLVLADGRTLNGIVATRSDAAIALRDAARLGETITIARDEIEEERRGSQSLMPAGQVNQLTSRQQFLDLVRYVLEIRDGGAARARQLQPPPALLAMSLPDYEGQLDHAGLIRGWNGESLRRGERIYQRVCANCHGTLELPGSLPTSLRFAEGKFKNGGDPHSIYRTLTHGFGLMAPQTWMVPEQKYDVIHYIRETYIKPRNASQFVEVDERYLARLPKGTTRGPAPSKIEPWVVMDYGPSLIHTYELPAARDDERPNLAYKGIAIRLDAGPGGVSRGSHWMLFDHDTLRMAGAWSASRATGIAAGDAANFIDWAGIQFDGRHGVHPRVVGDVAWTNPVGPGWGRPTDSSFADAERVVGRDGRAYGPLPRSWARLRGIYHHGLHTILSYRLGDSCDVLELPRLGQRLESAPSDSAPVFARQFNLGPRQRELVLNVARFNSPMEARLDRLSDSSRTVLISSHSGDSDMREERESTRESTKRESKRTWNWDGGNHAEVPADLARRLDVTGADFSLSARVRTREGGTIVAFAPPGPNWAPDGQTWFIRDGRLCFDIGWVGVVSSRRRVNDGQWHHVGLTWTRQSRRVQLFIDGKLDTEGTLAANRPVAERTVRLGFTSTDFPRPLTSFRGEMDDIRFYQRVVARDAWRQPLDDQDPALHGWWKLEDATDTEWRDRSGRGHHAVVRRGEARPSSTAGVAMLAGIEPASTDVKWEWMASERQLRLRIPAGDEPLRFTVWTTDVTRERGDSRGDTNSAWLERARASAKTVLVADSDSDLSPLTRGGPPRWPQKLTTQVARGSEGNAFAVDVLTHPLNNPWLAQLRFTGFDFLPDGQRLAICTWDGDVWLVTLAPGEESGGTESLVWQRVATGLFQPLGLKYHRGKIHVTCRDQLVVLHDLNGDEEIDFYETLNSDHQVTEHFHEFAMGLQTDAAGNFYYAKSARHALPAVVPHHGTLLRVSADGARTDILATGFRAANGVCLNPDGSFIVTDQEGHWNPKNRINWVRGEGPGEFFGNMFGYHDVRDSSDQAMRAPLCWITNSFDRSPAELLWVPPDAWGPLRGSLLNLSYGYGKIFVVPHENVQGVLQGGMCELPLPVFPTGLIRGRFHPVERQLYTCGMFSWAGSATQPGGFYRVRYLNKPVFVPCGLEARRGSIRIRFTGPIDAASVASLDRFHLKVWSLKRSANYGSPHVDERPLKVTAARLSKDGMTLELDLPDLSPTWGMEIQYRLQSTSGEPVVGTIHNTIHTLPAQP